MKMLIEIYIREILYKTDERLFKHTEKEATSNFNMIEFKVWKSDKFQTQSETERFKVKGKNSAQRKVTPKTSKLS
jgi:hypothetical protein